MNVIIKEIESNFRNIECNNIDCGFDVDHLNLLVQLLDMLDDYKRYDKESMPKTITDLVEWYERPHEETKLPFE